MPMIPPALCRLGPALLAAGLAATPVRAGGPAARLAYTIDRGDVPAVRSAELTVQVQVGPAWRVTGRADGRPVAVAHDPASGWATVTTAAARVELEVEGAAPAAPGFGEVRKAPLLGGKRWAWSHGFDDNTGFKQHGLAAFRERGWTATVFLICSSVEAHRDEPWIVDAPDLRRLAKEGWGIGNHGWTHSTARSLGPERARAEALRCADLLRATVEPALPGWRPMAFAAPAFDPDWQAVVDELRDRSPERGVRFNESGNDFLRQVDPGAFDPKATLGRDPAIEGFGSGNPGYDNRPTLLRVHELADGTRHWWYNTLSHAVDGQPRDRGLFAFLAFLHQRFGPGGTDEVWVAPSDRVYSYLLVRDASRVERVEPAPPR